AAHALAAADKRWLQTVGPASSPRAILESALQPMLTALGFAAVEAARPVSGALVGEARANGDVVTVVVVPWGDRLDGRWRTAVTAARQQSSSWCLLFNGATLRIVDALQLYSRRVADFDVALALGRDEGAMAIGLLAHADALCAAPGDPRSLRELVAASDR